MPLQTLAAVARVARAALAGALLYAAVLLGVWFGQERLLFQPEPLPAATPLASAPDVHERRVEVPGATLSVLELRLPDPQGVLIPSAHSEALARLNRGARVVLVAGAGHNDLQAFERYLGTVREALAAH